MFQLLSKGRNGKGNIYVFAAGNYRDNTNSNGLLTSPYTIAVSAVSNGGMSASFRSVGSSIMTVAYGEGQGSTNGIVRFVKIEFKSLTSYET